MPLLSRYHAGKPCSASGPTCVRLPWRGVFGVTGTADATVAMVNTTVAAAPAATRARRMLVVISASPGLSGAPDAAACRAYGGGRAVLPIVASHGAQGW